jgi:hypothetical protein
MEDNNKKKNERLSMNVGHLESLGISATKGSACWIDKDAAMEKALNKFQDQIYKPAMEKEMAELSNIVLPEEVKKEDIIFLYEVSEDRKKASSKVEDLAAKYLVVRREGASSGFIVYALYEQNIQGVHSSRWEINPIHVNPLIEELFKRLGLI